jgi:hypothetical protein
MKTNYLQRITIIILLNIVSYNINAQITNYVYALHNTQSGIFYFSQIDIATGNITDLQLMPVTGYNTYSCSAVNVTTQEFYYCDGTQLISIDANSGNVNSNITLPLPPLTNFSHIQYNPCDSNIYGLTKDQTNLVGFAKFNPYTGIFTNISLLSTAISYCFGCMTVIDPVANFFAFQSNGIIEIELTTGNIIYNSPLNNLPNESFGHIALKCNTHEIFGTSANTSTGLKFLATIDPATGNVSHVSASGWAPGLFKPVAGGDFINQFTGDYFYSGAGSKLLGANTLTGNLVYNKTIGNQGEILFINHFSSCGCGSPSAINNNAMHNNTIEVLPNPFSNYINVKNIVPNENAFFQLISPLGKIVFASIINSGEPINVSQLNLPEGIYHYNIFEEQQNTMLQTGNIMHIRK